MATTFTPNYNLAQPEVGGEPDTWGGLLNVNFGTLDTALKAVSDVANAAVPKAGGTMTGSLTINLASGNPTLWLRGVAGTQRTIYGSTGGNLRWELQLGNSASESGSNAGSDLALNRYNDAGTLIGTPLNITRANGAVSINGAVTVSASLATTSGNAITSGGAVNSNQDFKSTTGAAIVSPTGNGSVYMRPNNGTATGQAVFQSALMTMEGTVFATGASPAPTSPNNFAFRSSASFGGGLYLDDPGGGSSWGMYTTSGQLNLGSGSASGGSLTARVTVNTSGLVTATDFSATSDAALKTEVAPLRNATERLKQMRPRTYRKEGRPEAGWIAQEVERVLATAVDIGADGYRRVSPGQIGALVAACVLEIEERVTALEEQI